MKQRVIYYSKMTEDFAGTHIKTQKVDKTYPFIRTGFLWKTASFLLYYLIALPLVWLYMKIVYGLTVKNRRALRKIKGGFFLYGNHTHWSDSFLGPIVAAPKKAYEIAGADAVSIRGLKNIVAMLGCLPIPTERSALQKFAGAVKQRAKEGGCVAVFPEAHIWPYYTGVRPFTSTSFSYPAELNMPVVAMVRTYRKHRGLLKFIKTPRHIVTLSNPIYPKPGMSVYDAKNYLYRRVCEYMKYGTGTAQNYAYIQYTQKSEAKPQSRETVNTLPKSKTTGKPAFRMEDIYILL